MRVLSRIAAAYWFVLATVGHAGSPVVVELFTSQGCSSCPPADAILHELAEREDVIALALHVDYWDYIGWKDTFADPAYAERQRGYARVAGRRSIYTPQMIVNGQTSVVGARAMQIADAIRMHAAAESPVSVALERDEDVLSIKAHKSDAVSGPLFVHMLRYAPRSDAKITRGENAGRSLTYANVARDWQVLHEWHSDDALALTSPISGDAPVVILVQSGAHGAILGAARLR